MTNDSPSVCVVICQSSFSKERKRENLCVFCMSVWSVCEEGEFN